MHLIQYDHRILADIWAKKAFSQEHAIRHVLDPRLWARQVFETDCVANLLAERAADFLCNAFCSGHGGDATWLCATYSTIVCVAIFGKILRHLSCLPSPRIADNDENLVLFQTVRKLVEEYRRWAYISDCLKQWSAQLVYWQGLSLVRNARSRDLPDRSRHVSLAVIWMTAAHLDPGQLLLDDNILTSVLEMMTAP